MLPSRFLFSIMHFLMAKLHVVIESGCQPVLLSVQSLQQCCLPIVDIQEPYKYARWLMFDGAQFKNKLHGKTCNTFISKT